MVAKLGCRRLILTIVVVVRWVLLLHYNVVFTLILYYTAFVRCLSYISFECKTSSWLGVSFPYRSHFWEQNGRYHSLLFFILNRVRCCWHLLVHKLACWSRFWLHEWLNPRGGQITHLLSKRLSTTRRLLPHEITVLWDWHGRDHWVVIVLRRLFKQHLWQWEIESIVLASVFVPRGAEVKEFPTVEVLCWLLFGRIVSAEQLLSWQVWESPLEPFFLTASRSLSKRVLPRAFGTQSSWSSHWCGLVLMVSKEAYTWVFA